jgi:hypothetical protein
MAKKKPDRADSRLYGKNMMQKIIWLFQFF